MLTRGHGKATLWGATPFGLALVLRSFSEGGSEAALHQP
jgi:hypothetical protein